MNRCLPSLTVFALFSGGLWACVDSNVDGVQVQDPCAQRQALRAAHWGPFHDDDDDDNNAAACPTAADAGTIALGRDAGSGGIPTPDAGIARQEPDASVPPPSGDSGVAPAADAGSGMGGNDAGPVASTDAGQSQGGGDSGITPAPDAGGSAPDSGTCITSASCAVGSQCMGGTCQPCAQNLCTCQRDNDCPANQVCNHQMGTCEDAPPTCVMITAEAQCVARADCKPIYAGMNCTNSMGTTCQSGEMNCTCATYAFAACVNR